jgi:hypothetical protein
MAPYQSGFRFNGETVDQEVVLAVVMVGEVNSRSAVC